MKANNRVRTGWVLFMALLLAACSTQQPRVHEGRFQKRQHRGGWHVDLGKRPPVVSEERTIDLTEGKRIGKRTRAHYEQENPQFPSALISSEALPERPLERPISVHNEPLAVVDQGSTTLSVLSSAQANSGTVIRDLPAQDVKPPKVWNKWALPAFTLALATVAYGILGTNAVILVIAVVATLVIAAIALRKGRRYEWSGKGFALGAMILGTFAALITLIALLNGRV